MKFDLDIPIPSNTDDIEKRKKEISEILFEMGLNESKSFTTSNIQAWRTSFDNQKLRSNSMKKFTIKKQKDGSHRIWRIL